MAFGFSVRVVRVKTPVDADVRVAQVVGWDDPAKNTDGVSRPYVYVWQGKEYVIKPNVGIRLASQSWKYVESVIEQVGPRELRVVTRVSDACVAMFWGSILSAVFGVGAMAIQVSPDAWGLLAVVPVVFILFGISLDSTVQDTSRTLSQVLSAAPPAVVPGASAGPQA